MSSFRVPVQPALLEWAVERSGLDPEDLQRREGLRDLPQWELGTKLPTFRQLQKFAAATYTPFGFFFLPEPPVEKVPIPDFRTIGNEDLTRPSPNLLDTIFLCEQRQDWYRRYALDNDADPLPFVGSVTVETPVLAAARMMRRTLKFSAEDRASSGSWTAAFRGLIDSAEDVGVLVMVSGIVGNNTRRPLDYHEFRGFALADDIAPVVFINGTDSKAAQIFTLIHELAHIWLGKSALTDSDPKGAIGNPVEIWCNKVAAEFLVPIGSLRENFGGTVTTSELDRLARLYKVSTLVVLRRIFDGGFISSADYQSLYRNEWDRVSRLLARQEGSSGGNFYYTQPLRVSRRFASAIISDTLSGRTLHGDAYRLLGTRKHQTFVQLGEQIGVA